MKFAKKRPNQIWKEQFSILNNKGSFCLFHFRRVFNRTASLRQYIYSDFEVIHHATMEVNWTEKKPGSIVCCLNDVGNHQ